HKPLCLDREVRLTFVHLEVVERVKSNREWQGDTIRDDGAWIPGRRVFHNAVVARIRNREIAAGVEWHDRRGQDLIAYGLRRELRV
ncbi:MAG TPA: hypothetical protein VF772_22955, partial [Terriglobales bacterium]